MQSIHLQREFFNKLFPFFIQMDKTLTILDCGDSLVKLHPDLIGKKFNTSFSLKRPDEKINDFNSLINVSNALVVLEMADKNKTCLRGQFEYLSEYGQVLFAGSPWFNSIEQMQETQLTLNDFAIYDGIVDLLHLVKAQEVTTDDLKQLLQTISKQKNDLAENEQRLRVLSRIAEDNINAVVITDATSKITWANKSFSLMTGYSPSEYLGKNPGQLLQGKDTDAETAAYLKFQIGNLQSFNGELLNYTKDGKAYWVRISGQPLFNERNELTGFFAVEEDITRERAIEEQLIDSERRLSLSLEKIGDNVWEHDFRTNTTMFSKTNSQFLETPELQLDNADLWWKHVHTEDLAILEDNDQKLRSGQVDSHNLQYRMVHSDGTVRWVLDRGVVIEKDSNGLPLKIIGTHTDITEIKKTKAELNALVNQFKTLSENIPAVIYEYVFKANGTEEMKYVSPSMESVFGVSSEDFRKNPEQYVHPDDIEKIKTQNEISRKTRNRFSVEARMILPNGKILWHQATSSFAHQTEEGDLIFTGIMLNTTERKNAEDALRINEGKYRNIISNMNLGLLEVTADDVILFANDSFAKLTGYAIEEMIGKKASNLFLTDKKEKEFLSQKSDQRKQGFSDAYEILLYDRDKNPKWVMISGAPRYNDEGEYIGSIGIHLDITEHKQLEELLIKAHEEAMELAKTKELFLANMSHEIRTPLNAVIGMVRELTHTSLDRAQLQLVKNADISSGHLLSLVNNVLDLSKINSGNFELDKSVFNWHQLMEEVMSVTQASASEKGIELIFENEIENSEHFFGDPGRIRQVLFNVAGNAIKFTEKGHVLINCRKGETVNNQSELVLSITDTGIGMDAMFLNSIFEKFTQENNSIQRKYGGTGLGMSITKQLAELMGGRVEVVSELNKGTRFTIHLLVERAVAATPTSNLEPSVMLNGKKILVVEDNEMNRLVAKSMLVRNKMDVIFAENGQEALEQLRSTNFDLILMDLQMPVMDGLEATTRIRQMKIEIPIIALTANAFKAEIDHALQAGMNDFVAKPFDESSLLRKMKEAISKKAAAVDLCTHAVAKRSTTHSDEEVLINTNYMDEISGGSLEFRKEMYKIFKKQSQDFVEESRNLFDKSSWEEFRRLAHQFKPQGSYLGVNKLTQIVTRIEKECKQGHDLVAIKDDLELATEVIKKINLEIELNLS